MDSFLQLFLITCAITFLVVVVTLIMKYKINERSSVIWLGGAFIILLLSGQPKIIEVAATWLKIDYAPTLLFLLSTFVLLSFNLYHSIQISKLNAKIKDLSQYVALKEQEEVLLSRYKKDRKVNEL